MAQKNTYTKPELRERIKDRIMESSKGGKPGQWSARRSQLLAQEYEKGLQDGYEHAKKELADPDTQMDCPSCGKKWDTSKYSACSCGAILQNPDTQEGVEERLDIQSRMRLWAVSQCRHAHKMLDKAEELTCDDCLIQIVDEIVKQLLQQKPQKQVTRERIKVIASVLLNSAGLSYSAGQMQAVILILTEFCEAELGIEVVDKK